MKKFESTSFAKCIIAGEHSVLRGHPALVFPVKGCCLAEIYSGSEQAFEMNFGGDYGHELSLIIWGVLERACNKLGLRRENLRGQLFLRNNIPVGGGLGASAAICVALTRCFIQQGFIKPNELYEFARDLENLFHGESSGVDIAASMSDSGLIFERSGQMQKITLAWIPKLYVSYSGAKGVTIDCVKRVKEFIASNAKLGERIDQMMARAVKKSQLALNMSEDQGFDELASAIDMGRVCFHEWGLINEPLQSEMSRLLAQGAMAAKPTGSGLGGYVLSLWKDTPELPSLIPVVD